MPVSSEHLGISTMSSSMTFSTCLYVKVLMERLDLHHVTAVGYFKSGYSLNIKVSGLRHDLLYRGVNLPNMCLITTTISMHLCIALTTWHWIMCLIKLDQRLNGCPDTDVQLYCFCHICCVSENNTPTLASRSFDKYWLILIILGKQHQHTFKNDMHTQRSLSLPSLLLILFAFK